MLGTGSQDRHGHVPLAPSGAGLYSLCQKLVYTGQVFFLRHAGAAMPGLSGHPVYIIKLQANGCIAHLMYEVYNKISSPPPLFVFYFFLTIFYSFFSIFSFITFISIYIVPFIFKQWTAQAK